MPSTTPQERVIKFRAFDLDDKKMYLVDKLSTAEWVLYLSDSIKGKGRPVFMQFTGLKDKNGVEIYEGDILIDDEYPEEGVTYAKVEWYKNGFAAEPWFGVDEFTKEAENYEIIGNIYENPELLEGNQNARSKRQRAVDDRV